MINLTEQDLGQLFVYGFHGDKTTDEGVQALRRHIEAGLVGGVILFSYNIQDIDQVSNLNTYLTQLAAQGATDPLFICVDQEGGRVQRLRHEHGFTVEMPSALELASLPSWDRQDWALRLAKALKQAGFNLNFSPVVDLYTPTSSIIGQLERSFSRCPHEVIEAAQDVVKGLRQGGVFSCLKHFPGHGLATGDSHLGLVDITDTAQTDELLPYKILIERNMADMIMTAHLCNRNIDNQFPASLSSKMIKALLRRQFGYQGVVISDDLHMGAIRQQFDLKQAILLALKAGNDMIILSHNPAASGGHALTPDLNLPEKAVAWVQEALMSGELDPQEIYEAVGRIRHLKRQGLRPELSRP